jgi:hypothetical protein
VADLAARSRRRRSYHRSKPACGELGAPPLDELDEAALVRLAEGDEALRRLATRFALAHLWCDCNIEWGSTPTVQDDGSVRWKLPKHAA